MKPVLTEDGSRTLYSDRYGQTYHSRYGAVTEARHVFLEASGVRGRLEARVETAVLEVGFGTGLNYLVTADAALTNGTALSYTALELDLLPADVLAALDYGRAVAAPELAAEIVDWRRALAPVPEPGAYRTSVAPNIRLTVILGEATDASLPHTAFDAVYLDAFDPGANPELWTGEFISRLFGALRAGGPLATYSASGAVRRAFESAGFAVEKRQGPPGGKREITVATKPADTR